MLKLLVHSDRSLKLSDTSFGGLPVKNKLSDFNWPNCDACKLPMQYLGKVSTDLGIENIFMCQNDPGCCGDWEPDSGANKVVIVENGELELVQEPERGETTRGKEYGVIYMDVAEATYNDALDAWPYEEKYKPRDLLGQFLGAPEWIQGDETPECSGCKTTMRFVAQLEQGPNWETEMNFGGGGCAYLFDCKECMLGKFLWQC